ncbi:MAG: hypothetical protein JWN60_1058 [Acidobacteria bacterium]|nr:hypothetical protein [Acidobacteriota bacterium]
MKFLNSSCVSLSSFKDQFNYCLRSIFQDIKSFRCGKNGLCLIFFGFFSATSFPPFSASAQTGVVRFAVIGDYGTDSSGERDVADLVKSRSPDFIIGVGDNNYPDGETSTIDRNVGKYYHEFIFPYNGNYGAGASENRFFPTLGNHDWHAENAQPYLDYFNLPGNERYYDFVRGPVHFFAIDSDSQEPDGSNVNSVQANWLKNKLASSKAVWKIVYFHHPPYSSGKHGSTERLQWKFKEWGATTVISGHDHIYERLLINNFPYFVNGLGGAGRYSLEDTVSGSQKRYNADYGAMFVEASSAEITFRFVNREQVLIDSYTITDSPQFGAPNNLRATTVSNNQINLSWTDNSNSESGFLVERCRGTGCANFQQIGQVGANVTDYSDSGLEAAVYAYRVRAFNETENSAYSNSSEASTITVSPTDVFSDNFDDGIFDASKWTHGIFSRHLSSLDAQTSVIEQNGRLQITPRAGEDSGNYNGYVSTSAWNMTGSSAEVEVVQSGNSKTVTILAVGTDDDNWYRFRAKGGTLYLERRKNGSTSRTAINFDKTRHRFWRLRHDPAADTIVFETSPDGEKWTARRTVERQTAITALKIELIAGTIANDAASGTVLFDNFILRGNTAQ